MVTGNSSSKPDGTGRDGKFVKQSKMLNNSAYSRLGNNVDCLALTVDCLTLTVDYLTLTVDCLTLTVDYLTVTVDCPTLTVDCLTLTVDYCLYISVDCWDGSGDEPVVYHGHTLTSSLSLLLTI